MPVSTKAKSPWTELEPDTEDGRRQRSNRSRRRIIEALFDLMRSGDMSPSAVSVAEKANVGLRTVFRHFEDMESIYIEMTEEAWTATMPKIIAPYESTTWRDRLMESLEKRAEIYEMIFPLKVCLSLKRFQSETLARQYDRDVHLERSTLKSILPQEIVTNRTLFAALEITLSFSTWRRLRQDQKLSVDNAKQAVRHMLRGLIASADAEI